MKDTYFDRVGTTYITTVFPMEVIALPRFLPPLGHTVVPIWSLREHRHCCRWCFERSPRHIDLRSRVLDTHRRRPPPANPPRQRASAMPPRSTVLRGWRTDAASPARTGVAHGRVADGAE